MNDDELKTLGAQFARLDEALAGIHATQERQETALIEIFKESRAANATAASLNTVVRMSISEQQRINQEFRNDIIRLDKVWDERGRDIERKVAYFAGGLAVLLVALNFLPRLF